MTIRARAALFLLAICSVLMLDLGCTAGHRVDEQSRASSLALSGEERDDALHLRSATQNVLQAAQAAEEALGVFVTEENKNNVFKIYTQFPGRIKSRRDEFFIGAPDSPLVRVPSELIEPLRREVIGLPERSAVSKKRVWLIADTLCVAIRQGLIDTTLLWMRHQDRPLELAFLALALEDCIPGNDPGVATVLERPNGHPYLLMAALRHVARYGTASDLPLVEKYFEHKNVHVARTAAYAAWILRRFGTPDGRVCPHHPLFPPQQFIVVDEWWEEDVEDYK